MKALCEECNNCVSISKHRNDPLVYSACFYRTPFDEESSIDGLPGLHSLPVPTECEGFLPRQSIVSMLKDVLKKYAR